MTVNRPAAGAHPRLHRSLALLALVPTALVSVGGGVALADNVTNDVTTSGKIVSTTVGSPATVTFSLVETDKTSAQDDANGCNAAPSHPVTLTASGSGVVVDHDTAVTGTQSSRVVTSCDSWAFTFTSSNTGDKAITVTATGGKANSTYNVSGAAFNLRVAPAAPTAAATSLALAPADGIYDAASTNLAATLTSGSSAVAGKTVSFTVGGVPVGSAITQPDGVATLTYPLNKTVAAGSHVTGASWSGDGSFASSNSSPSTLTVAKADQLITVGALAGKTFGDAAFAVAGSASSGLAVAIASTTPSVCTLAGGSVSIVAAGSCSLTASQGGDTNWNPATDVTQAFTVAKASQTIYLSLNRTTATFQDGQSTTVNAGATSGLPVALSITGPCTLHGTTLTVTGAGNCLVTGKQVGGDNYLAAVGATQTLNIAKANQTIDFAQPADKTFGDSAFTLGATASSSQPVSYTAAPANVCTVSGNTVALGNAGECTITASQAGNENFNTADAVGRTFTVDQAAQTITFDALGNKTFGDDAFTVSATAPGGPVTFAAAGPCTVAGTTVTITGAGAGDGAGDCTITASQGGSNNYLAAADVPRSFTIAKADQTITFPALSGRTYAPDLAAFPTGAWSSAPLPLTVTAGPTEICSATDGLVTVHGAGDCTVTVNAAGNENYNAAAPASSTFTIAKADQLITFAELGGKTFGDAASAVAGSASSGLAVVIASTTTDVCTVADGSVSIVAAGSCSLTASQAGDTNWNPATAVVQAFEVAQASQTISLSLNRTTATFQDNQSVTVDASATSGLPVALSVAGPCTLNDTTLTVTGAGNCVVTGKQAGSGNYLPAEDATATLNIAKADQTIDFAQPAGKTFGDSAVTLGATASSDLTVSYAAAPADVCTVDGSTVTLGNAGACTITASQAGNDDFNSAADVPRTFAVAPAAQTISFAPLGDKTFGGDAFTVSATAPGGPVSFTSDGQCTVAGTTVTITGAGTCTITASQGGSNNHFPAPAVERSFTIAKADQTISYPAPTDKTYGDAPVTVGANATSLLPVAFATDTPTVCTVSGTTVSLVSAGDCTVVASQPGDRNRNAAPSVSRSFTVAPAALTVTAPTLTRLIGAANPELTPTYSGWVNGEGLTVLTTPATCTTTATVASPVGTYPVTCSGARSGNYVVTNVPGTLTVVYGYSALLAPINVDRSSAFKSGSTVPVKFQVLGAGNVVQDANDLRATIKVTKIGSATVSSVNEEVLTAGGDTGNTFRWDASGRQYIYNLSTKTWSMGEGRYRVDVLDTAGKVLTTGEFQVKK